MLRTPTWDVGYSLFEPFLGKGYATEAVKAVIQLMCEELKAKRIELIINAENEASKRLATRLGFTHEVTQREHEWNAGAHQTGRHIDLWLTLPSMKPMGFLSDAVNEATDEYHQDGTNMNAHAGRATGAGDGTPDPGSLHPVMGLK